MGGTRRSSAESSCACKDTEGLVAEPLRWHLRVLHAAVGRRAGAPISRRAAWDNPAAWDISGLEPYLQRFDINFNPDYLIDIPRPTWAAWFGDNWRVTNDLSVNFGVRYDVDSGATDPPFVTPTVIMINNGRESGDFGYKTGIRDLNNVAPRVGFAYNVGGKNDLVIRGGTGFYYNTPVSNVTYSHQYFKSIRSPRA